MRVIGMDSHRACAEVVALLDGVLTRLGRVDMRRDRLEAFARSTLTHDDHVVVEATGKAAAVVEALCAHVGRGVIANPKRVRLVADARIKTDKIDATVLAKLYASGFLPEVWVPDARTEAMRRQVTRRTRPVRQRTRLKNIVQSILHARMDPHPGTRRAAALRHARDASSRGARHRELGRAVEVRHGADSAQDGDDGHALRPRGRRSDPRGGGSRVGASAQRGVRDCHSVAARRRQDTRRMRA
jgi:transposase